MAELYDHEFLSTEFPHDVMFACDGFDSESSHVGIQGSMAVQHNHTTPTTATAAAHRCTKTQKNNNDDDDERMCGRCRCCCRNIQKLDGDWNRSYPTWYIIKRGRLFPLCAALIRFVLLFCVLDVRASCGPCMYVLYRLCGGSVVCSLSRFVASLCVSSFSFCVACYLEIGSTGGGFFYTNPISNGY